MNALTLHSVSVSEMDNNCYLLACGEQGLLVDAAAEPTTLLAMAESAGAVSYTHLTLPTNREV